MVMKQIERIFLGTLDPHPWRRLAWVAISFFSLFYLSVILSFLLLPDGALRGKHPIVSSLTLAPDFWTSALQIFSYNLMPTTVVAGGNLFAAPSRLVGGRLLPQGYLGLWALALLTGAYLGSWSFEIVTPAPPFWERLVHPLDIVHNSGLIEQAGYIAAATASARWSRVWSREGTVAALEGGLSFKAAEWGLLVLGLALVATGALVESRAILEVTTEASTLPLPNQP